MSGPAGDEAPLLTVEELSRVCDFIYRRSGMSYGEPKRYYVERRIADRMAQTGAVSFAAYFGLIRSSAVEAERLINAFTVNETYFYREEHQLRCLSRSLLPELVKDRVPGDLVRIWSMPCSTGEEPYSIAIWLLENWALVDAYNIEIVGSDIDTQALAEAAVADYGERSVARLPPDVLAAYFHPPRNGMRQLIQDLRESVTFTQVNLIDPSAMAAQGLFDVIFCRNVLIYFDDPSRLAASRLLYDALRPAGFICLGHTESMGRISRRFTARRFEDATVYQRPAT